MSKISFAKTLRPYNLKHLPSDIFTGIIIAAVSIPISMGYAQIAGLPSVYGLYGSVFPIILFALFTTSPQFIFGVDAAPAALVGAALCSFEIAPGSPQALKIVPIITLFVALWLLLFYLLGAGKLVNYLSTPVMGGFITGICCTIILMQLPKLFGGTAGTGELFELLAHLGECIPLFTWQATLLGCLTLAILLISKKLFPKFPMAIAVMLLGILLSKFLPLADCGIPMLAAVESGMPHFILPDFSAVYIPDIIGVSLSVAIVIMAETLLSENSFAMKGNYKINDNQELFAFFAGNCIAAFIGCCPINGSVSRTTMSAQYGGKTQATGIAAGLSMILVLLFGTPLIGYLPVPVLTAIVISALISATEFHLARRLWHINRTEFLIFCGAFSGVLVLGTINGVLIGLVLSFTAVIIRASNPPRGFLGLIPGHDEFVNIGHYRHAYPLENIVIYRFSSDLFFANISLFENDLENSIDANTKAIIVDASGIGNIDVTAAEHLEILYANFKKKNIRFYLTEHISTLNDQLRALGLSYMIQEGAVRRTIPIALADMNIHAPYPIVGEHLKYHSVARSRVENTMQEFIWAYGSTAEDELEKMIYQQIDELRKTGDFSSLTRGNFHILSSVDEDEWLERLEAHILEIAKATGTDADEVARQFEKRRLLLLNHLEKEHPELLKYFHEHRMQLDKQLQLEHPQVYEHIKHLRDKMSE